MAALKRMLIFSIIFFFSPQFIKATSQTDSSRQRSTSFFPIIMYNSDIGFGYGGKGVIKNGFHNNESFDLILFGSSKGQQWYEFKFSIPDFEIRQKTRYPLALDLRMEYNKQLKSNFFDFGNNSRDNEWQFPKEFIKIEVTLGRAFTETIIGEAGLFINYCSVYNYQDINQLLSPAIPGAGENLTSYITTRLRWDTRDSRIHPRQGWNLGFNSDFAFKFIGSDYNFRRFRLELSNYQQLFSPSHIFAWRLWGQQVTGLAPFYEQSIIGGTWTSRGYKADRFINKAMLLASFEYRFDLFRQLGSVLFIDNGRTFSNIDQINFKTYEIGTPLEESFYLKNFLVRFDMGFSPEGTRIFLHFGHVF